jgi:hypothetical protein
MTASSNLCVASCCGLLLWLSACQKPTVSASTAATQETKAEADSIEDTGTRVSLKLDEVEKLGVATTEAKVIAHTPETTGFGTVMSHDAIAQGVAEFATANAIERQSRAAFARAQKLAGTPGAVPIENQEAAERQLMVDQAALELAKRRLSGIFGQNPPWKNQDSNAQLAALAGGETKLVRVTFPLGALGDANPSVIRLAHINAVPGRKMWESKSVWSAPADSNVPGKSFFALLKGSDVGEGERLLAWTPEGSAESGVQIPASAVLINGGKYWCYVEEKPGLFVRTEIDTSMPTAEGYFVTTGISAGDKVVTKSAGLLLARETNPSKEAE